MIIPIICRILIFYSQQSAESASRSRYSSDEAEQWKMKYELEKQKVSQYYNIHDSPNAINITSIIILLHTESINEGDI